MIFHHVAIFMQAEILEVKMLPFQFGNMKLMLNAATCRALRDQESDGISGQIEG